MNINLKIDLSPNEASYLFAALTKVVDAFENEYSPKVCDESDYYQFLLRLRHMLNYT